MSLDHPLHPSTVHWPLTFLATSYGLDALTASYAYIPSSISSVIPPPTDLTLISYYSLSLGLLTSLPAISSGIAQALQMVTKQGIKNPDGTIKNKVKVLAAHAAINDVVVGLSAWVWWGRRKILNTAGEKGIDIIQSSAGAVGLSVLLGAAILFAANLGGSLVYDYGVGLTMGKQVIKGEKKE